MQRHDQPTNRIAIRQRGARAERPARTGAARAWCPSNEGRPTTWRSAVVLVAGALLLPFAGACSPSRRPAPPAPGEVATRLNGLAVPFVENAGQSDPRVAYYAQTFSGTAFVTREGELVYALPAPAHRRGAAVARDPGWTLTERFVGGHAAPVAAEPAPTRLSVFVGDDPARWQSQVASYADVDLGAVWPGIAVTLRAYGKQVEKVFNVEPGAAPETIRVRVAGAQALAVADDGGLMLRTGVGDVRLTPPVAYQEIDGTRRNVSAAYDVAGDEYGYRLAAYDPTRPVVIDPLLQATYLGGGNADAAIAIDIAPTTGDVYVAGFTASIDFPGTGGGAQRFSAGQTDAFVARLNGSLTALEWATYLGGSVDDDATALAIEPTTGDVYVAGFTNSTDFPGTRGGAQSTRAPCCTFDAFVARLNPTLTVLDQATYLGGSLSDSAAALALARRAGGTEVYVAGTTLSADFPGTGLESAQVVLRGTANAFIARLNAGLTALHQATYLGGSDVDVGTALAIAPTTGDVYVAGVATSRDFPGTSGGAQDATGGGDDAFVAWLNADLTMLEQATYLGGSNVDDAIALAIAPATGDVYVAGETDSDDFPGTAGGAQSGPGGGRVVTTFDAFVARLDASLTALDQATYPGGAEEDTGLALAIAPATGDVYVAGQTDSDDFPGTAGGAQGGLADPTGDAFVARLDASLTALDQSTCLGGNSLDGLQALAIAPTTGDVYVAGQSLSTNFPGTAGGAQSATGGGDDAFVARLSADLRRTTATTTIQPTATTTSSTTTTSTTTTTLVVTNTPPTVSIDDLPDKVKRKELDSGRLLTVHLTVSEPATITLDIVNREGTPLRRTTLERTTAGSFETQISLRHARGSVTLRVTATDVDGASTVVERQFKAQ